MRISHLNDDNELVTIESGTLRMGDGSLPIVNGEVQLPDTPFIGAIARSEQDLLERYRKGEIS